MNDFLDHAASSASVIACPSQHELLLRERDEAAAKAEPERLRKDRDDARAEADRLKGEVDRLAKERDDLAEKLKAEAARSRSVLPVTPPGPCQDKTETLKGLRAIEEIIDAPAIGFVPGNVAHRLARVALIVGRLIAAAR